MMKYLSATAGALLLSASSLLAQTGLDPVMQALEQQGFTQMETVREANQIRIRATRGDSVRELVYDASTGELLSDDMLTLQDRDRDRLRDLDGDGVPDQDRDQDRDRDMVDAPTAGGARQEGN